MLILVSGAAASGKSAYAEHLVVQSGIFPRAYVACMMVRDGEDALRVARHRELRKNKGFLTLEAPTALERAAFPENGAVLIEDAANLAANECFSTQEGFALAQERILSGVKKAMEICHLTVVVTCEIGSDGAHYEEDTARYLLLLSEINAQLAALSDEAYEVVAGIALPLKGGFR